MKEESQYNSILSGYLHRVLDLKSRNAIVKKTVDFLKKNTKCFDTIVFRGMSGAIIAPIVSYLTKKPIGFVRKGEECHSTKNYEGNVFIKNYCFIDDIVESGKTLEEVDEKCKEIDESSKCKIIVLYHYNSYYDKKNLIKKVKRIVGNCKILIITENDL